MEEVIMNREFEIPATKSWKRVFEPRLLYYLVFIGIAILYMITLATTITATGDSSEMVVSPYVLGVAHPPGYPLFTLLGHLFTYLPIFNIAYRINIFSMFFSLLALVFCFEILKKLIKNDLISIICVAFLAITRLIWEYSIVAEVFALNNFFVLLLFYIVIKWEETGSRNIVRLCASSFRPGSSIAARNSFTLNPVGTVLLVATPYSAVEFNPKSRVMRQTSSIRLFVKLQE